MIKPPNLRLERLDLEELDREDTLAHFRGRFELADDLVYLDGNSLGACPKDAQDAIDRVRREWSSGLINSWFHAGWLQAPLRIGDKIGRLIGAAAGQVAVTDSTSVNLFKLLMAGVDRAAGRRVLLSESGIFPTDAYIVRDVAKLRGLEVREVARETITEHLDADTALVLVSHADYKTSWLHHLPTLVSAARSAGALTLVDLCHSAGALPIDLDAVGVDLAVGCTYKYLNGGPGAPAFLYVARALQSDLSSPLPGWMGHQRPLEFEDSYQAAGGIARFLAGTPPILAYAALEAAVDVALEADLRQVRAKSIALGQLFIRLADQELREAGVEVVSPRDPERRGSQVSLSHPRARAVMERLAERGVIGDFRPPALMRFGFAPLYTRYTDCWEAIARCRTILEDLPPGD